MGDEILQLLDELCELETARQGRALAGPEHARWLELQKRLTRELCDFSTGAEEKRKSLRVPCPLEVRVVSADNAFVGTAIDVSAGGIGVSAGLLPALGESVRLMWASDGKELRFELDIPGHVVWLRKLNHELGAGFGVAFAPETPTQEQRIGELLLYLLRRERQKRS